MEPNIPGLVGRAARLFGDAEALVEPGGLRLTHTGLAERVDDVARTLAAAGVDRGDRLALWAPNSADWVLAALGALSAGAVLVPVNTRLTGPEAWDLLRRTRARALVVTGEFLGRDRLAELRAAAGTEPLPRTVIALPDWPDVPAGAPPARAVRGEDPCDILFTSGTTGRSKGAVSAHRQSIGVAAAWAECGGLTAADRYLAINPFFHSFGYKAGILACLVSGAALVPQAVFDAEEAMRVIEAERITVLPGPPTVYQTLLDHPARASHDLSSLRLAVTGAATVPAVLVERMRDELGFETVLTAYGLTEAVVATMCRPGDEPETVARTSGRAVAGFEVRIAPDGEILLRGPNVMLGYLDDPAATRAAVDAEGWLRTGDLGRLDARGNLSITGRLGDMYISGGFNVYPAEVEQVLARLDGVAESAVVGVPDARLGEVGAAFVVPRPGYALSVAQVLDHCRTHLANYKVPRRVEFRADLPRTPAGKPLKRVLREEQ